MKRARNGKKKLLLSNKHQNKLNRDQKETRRRQYFSGEVNKQKDKNNLTVRFCLFSLAHSSLFVVVPFF